jgi:hypothetical protein
VREKTRVGKVAGNRKGLFRPRGYENLLEIGEHEIPGQINCHPACDKDAYSRQVAAFGDLPLLSRPVQLFSAWRLAFFLACSRLIRQFAALSHITVWKNDP